MAEKMLLRKGYMFIWCHRLGCLALLLTLAVCPFASGADAPADELLRRSRALEDSNPGQALAFAHQALNAARAKVDRPGQLNALLQIAEMSRLITDYAGVDEAAQEGLSIAETPSNAPMRAEFYLVLGATQWSRSETANATENFMEAMRLGELLGDKKLQFGAQRGLGLVRDRYEDHDGALEHLEAARRLAEELNDSSLLASILNNLGNHYLELKDFPAAKSYYEYSIGLLKDGDDPRLRAYLLLNLGHIATETGDQALAGKHLSEVVALCHSHQLRRVEADAEYLLAAMERRLGQPDAALVHLQQALAIAETLKTPDLFALIYEEGARIMEARGDFRAALDYARKLAEQTEIIRGEKSRQRAVEIENRYEAEARLRKIKLLQRSKDIQQAELALINAELSRALTQRYALAAVLVLAGVAVAALVSRQRSRVRASQRLLAKTQAAKELAEEASALKARLLANAENHLHESEERFRSAFEHSPLGLALVSPEGQWLRVNPALCQIVGYTETELLQKDFQTMTHPEDLSLDMKFVRQLLRGDIDTYHLEKRYFHKEGHTVWTALDVSLVRESVSWRPRYFISQVQDITEGKRSQEALRAAKDEAERANAAKSEFLSRVSHELRTPLNAILGFGQLLELETFGTQHDQSVQHILTAGRHLLKLINEVLDISRIESGQPSLAPEEVDVGTLARESLELVSPLAAQAGVRLLPCREETPLCVRADPQRLKQVLLNLLSNAIKYNRRGGEVTLCCRGVEGNRLRIEVTDTGMGIAPEDIDIIFAPFTRLPDAYEFEGTGLGLSLSKTLTEAMGGLLGVSSEPGRGSVFWVEFMRAETTERLASADGETLSAIELEVLGLRGATLLCIEDNLANLQLLERLLGQDHDVRLLTARQGRTGVEMARERRPDLILLDLHLPDMSGEEVLRALRQAPETADVPVIVISADATLEQVGRLCTLGACDYLTKPFGIQDLRRAIDEALRAVVA